MSAKHGKKRVLTQVTSKEVQKMPNEAVVENLSSTVNLPNVKAILQELESELKSKLITYYLCEGAQISDDAILPLYKQLRGIGQQERINFFIHSRGGVTETPWKIIEMFRNYCKFLCVLIAYRAHSAATHIALGANEIIMTSLAELGPVDPYRTHPLLPNGPDGNPVQVSVQDMKHCVSFIQHETQTPYSSEAFANIVAAMFEKIHPLAIGAIEQSYALSQIISEKALATHMDISTDGEKISEIAKTLLDGYKSHTFQIGRSEAKQIGLPITNANAQMEDLLWKLYETYSSIESVDVLPIPGAKNRYQKVVGFIESVTKRFVCFGQFELGEKNQYKPTGAIWREI